MKLLVANRGEIAVRILRTCREMEIPSAAVYSEADKDSLHTRYADEAVHIGPTQAADSYLNIPAVLNAAKKVNASAIHPGYGFLSENPMFAKAVEDAGLIFIGPRSETISKTGDKMVARRIAQENDLPVIPGSEISDSKDISAKNLSKLNFPVLVKASAGGGGRGIRLASTYQELEEMIAAARKEAKAAFGDDSVYLEQLVQQARHIEVQILGDGKGKIICLGDRECSIQRRRQKLIEEAPAPGIPGPLRNKIYEAAMRITKSLKYHSLGTVEFLLDQNNDFYFIEINPRIQVEHPVTEWVTQTDLVAAQLQLAIDGSLRYQQEQIKLNGCSIEARILAEDPENGFLPVSGEISHLQEPSGIGIRLDSALYLHQPINTHYDSLLSKVIAWGENRSSAIKRLQRALLEYQIGGIPTDIDFLMQILSSEKFQTGHTDTTYLDTFQPIFEKFPEEMEKEIALATALHAHQKQSDQNTSSQQDKNNWLMTAWNEQM
ncbi:MAG: ATP-grasp domain-containing protein [Anaerolineaceae bacterium]|nr:ATP-grasp domain-containing protein [Anaerolineaceae bacterium]